MKKYVLRGVQYQPGRYFQNFLVSLDRLDQVPWWAMIAGMLTFLAGVTNLWPGHRLVVFLLAAAAMLIEAAVIGLSHALPRSPSPFGGPFFLYAWGHIGATILAGIIPLTVELRLWIDFFAQALLLAMMVYGSMIEPFRVRMRQTVICSPPDKNCAENGEARELRIFLVTDLHLDCPSSREIDVLKYARAFEPDIILFPGDFTNLSFVGDAETMAAVRRMFEELMKVAPVYASRGTPEVDGKQWTDQIFAGLSVAILDHQRMEITVKGVDLCFVGIPCEWDDPKAEASLAALLAEPTDKPIVLLHHTPDLAEAAARMGVSLYLAGHTHGGQVCLPLYGAIYTASRYHKRFVGGDYQVDGMNLVVSRGVGLEGAGAPRLRFFSPPEVVGIIWKVGKSE